jgi:hypothetical protein
MSSRDLIWAGRIGAIAVLALLHLMIFTGFIIANIGGSLARGPGGVELGAAYYESPQGQRNRLAIDILEWPLLKPVQMARSYLPSQIAQSLPWRLAEEASLFANSLVWGIGIWMLLELLARGLSRPFRRR